MFYQNAEADGTELIVVSSVLDIVGMWTPVTT